MPVTEKNFVDAQQELENFPSAFKSFIFGAVGQKALVLDEETEEGTNFLHKLWALTHDVPDATLGGILVDVMDGQGGALAESDEVLECILTTDHGEMTVAAYFGGDGCMLIVPQHRREEIQAAVNNFSSED